MVAARLASEGTTIQTIQEPHQQGHEDVAQPRIPPQIPKKVSATLESQKTFLSAILFRQGPSQ